MVVSCPNCKREFLLKTTPPRMFVCPKCSFTTLFEAVMNGVAEKQVGPSSPVNNPKNTVSDDATQVVPGIGGAKPAPQADPNKTKLVQGLQANRQFGFMVSFSGSGISRVALPPGGQFTLGRKSSDSTAQIKIAPDNTMSRVQAGMRVIPDGKGNRVYQITSIKDENPVYVNNRPLRRGEACTLKMGDVVKMGHTTLRFTII